MKPVSPTSASLRVRLGACGAALVLLVGACGNGSGTAQDRIEAPRELAVTSSAFAEGETIPVEFTCEGDNESPPLRWRSAGNADRYALTMFDPDAPGGFVHWVAFDIPTTSLPSGDLPQGTIEGASDSGPGYTGPCPPPGDEPHRYVFTVYAVSDEAQLPEAGASMDELLAAIECCVEAKGTLTGRYGR